MSTAPIPTPDDDGDVTDAELVPAVPDGQPLVPARVDEQDAGVLANLHTDDEWEGVGDGDLTGDIPTRIPYLKQDSKAGGGIIDPETGEKLNELSFIWLAKGKSRAWWSVPYGQGDGLTDCRSFDGIKADPNSRDIQNGGDCSSCPHAQWTESKKGDQLSPACSESIEAMVFLPGPIGSVGRLARLRFHGLGIGPAKAYWDSFFTVLPKRPPIAFVSKLTLEEVDTPNGKFLRPHFERVEALTRADAQPLIDERDRRLSDWQADVADEVTNRTATSEAASPSAGPFDKQPEPGSEARTVEGTPGTDEEPF